MSFYKNIPLQFDKILLKPLTKEDFEILYEVASDPEVWAMHPNKDRYKREVFKTFFEGAIETEAAYLIIDSETKQVLGSTRFYDFDESDNSIHIGYTFYGTQFWGKGFNLKVKKGMLDYIFQFVDTVKFHIGAENFRSQSAIQKLGATKIKELEVAYHGEPVRLNYLYQINKSDWLKTEIQP